MTVSCVVVELWKLEITSVRLPKLAGYTYNCTWPLFFHKANIHENVKHLKSELKIPFHVEMITLAAGDMESSK